MTACVTAHVCTRRLHPAVTQPTPPTNRCAWMWYAQRLISHIRISHIFTVSVNPSHHPPLFVSMCECPSRLTCCPWYDMASARGRHWRAPGCHIPPHHYPVDLHSVLCHRQCCCPFPTSPRRLPHITHISGTHAGAPPRQHPNHCATAAPIIPSSFAT